MARTKIGSGYHEGHCQATLEDKQDGQEEISEHFWRNLWNLNEQINEDLPEKNFLLWPRRIVKIWFLLYNDNWLEKINKFYEILHLVYKVKLSFLFFHLSFFFKFWRLNMWPISNKHFYIYAGASHKEKFYHAFHHHEWMYKKEAKFTLALNNKELKLSFSANKW